MIYLKIGFNARRVNELAETLCICWNLPVKASGQTMRSFERGWFWVV